MMPAQKTEQYRDELRSSRTEMVQHEDMNMTMHSTITIREDGPYARLTQAWQWLETQRSASPDSADIWHLRHRHATDGAYLTDLLHTLQSGRYRLSPMQLCGEGENKKAMWGAQDALVLKWVALCIQPLLPLHLSCEHVKGHGGGKQLVGKPHDLLTRTYTGETQHNDSPKKTSGYPWVCRTDIRGYYQHINKDTLFAQVRQHVSDPVLRDLVHQYLHYTVEDGGTFHTPETGISRGCALSPLMGALHLYDMDAHFSAQKNIHYARYMDDVIILAKSRWSLRRHTKRLMQWFAEYGFEAHPDKTQIGRTEKGFDWLGAWLTHEGVTDIAPRAKANHREKVRRLYEQLARVPKWLRHRRQQQVHARVSTYRKRWHIWAGALLTIAGVTTSAADRPIYVLSGTIPAGTSVLPGGDFTTLVNRVESTVSFDLAANSYALVNWSPSAQGYVSSCGSSRSGITTCVPVSGTPYYGFGVDAVPGLILVPWYGSVLTVDGVSTLDEGARVSVPVDPTIRGGLDCQHGTYTGSGGIEGCSTTQPLALMVNSIMKNPLLKGSTVTSSLSLVLRPYCVDCQAGSTQLSVFGLGHPNQIPPLTDVSKPTAVVVVGLTCNITSPSNGNANAGVVAANKTAGEISGTAPIEMSVSCMGTNSTSSDVPIGVTITPSGTTQTQGDYQLVDPAHASFYSTLTKGAADCSTTGTNANKMKVGVQYSNPVRTYAANEAGKTDTLNLVWALCSTGNMTQAPGNYSMTATATIVSF